MRSGLVNANDGIDPSGTSLPTGRSPRAAATRALAPSGSSTVTASSSSTAALRSCSASAPGGPIRSGLDASARLQTFFPPAHSST